MTLNLENIPLLIPGQKMTKNSLRQSFMTKLYDTLFDKGGYRGSNHKSQKTKIQNHIS